MPLHDLDQLSIDQSSTPEGYRVIRLKGWVTAKNTPALLDIIHQSRGLNTVLDLAEVPYMDSSGLGALLNGYLGCQKYGGQFVLASAVPRVRELLQLTKVDGLFRMYLTPEDAVIEFTKTATP